MNKTIKEKLQLSIENIVNRSSHLHKDQVYHKLTTPPSISLKIQLIRRLSNG